MVSNQEKIELTSIKEIFDKQRNFFYTQKTKDLNFRIAQLKTLHEALNAYNEKISDAMYADLRRSKPMTYYSEIGMSLKTISMTIRNLKKWARPKKVRASWDIFPLSKCWVQFEPLGQTLLISAWNYPVTLTIGPLTAALSAGNTAILKPSELAPNVSGVIYEMIHNYFDDGYIAVCQGGKEVAGELLELPFDHIMYTGGSAVGKIIMEAASKHLTPVTLELGGKSPVIVDKDIDLAKSAKRIVLGKFVNCGQTCIAPDHVFVHEKIADRLIDEMNHWMKEFFSTDPLSSPDFGKMINQRHFERVSAYLKDGKIQAGGQVNKDELYIAPTLMTDVSFDAPIMQEEIFGPILPIFTFTNLDDILALFRTQPKPLALYIYSRNRKVHEKVLAVTTSGGVAINDSMTQFVSMNLPFGGVGKSGMGRYHGHYGFETFSHHRAIMKQTNLIDLKMKYPPVTEKTVKMLKAILK